MQLYQIIRQVIQDQSFQNEDEPITYIPGMSQIVWEGKSKLEANRQLLMARDVESPKGSICLIHETTFTA